MPTPTKGPRFGGSPAHERIILDNLASQLFEHGRITTTEAKAKRVRPLAEKLITKAKRGDLAARRQVLTHIRDKSVVHVLFTEIAEAVADRDGGYTRIVKIGPRKGDNAPMVILEVVTEKVQPKAKATKSARTTESAEESNAKAAAAATAATAAPSADAGAAVEADTEAATPAEEAAVEEAAAVADAPVPDEAVQDAAGEAEAAPQSSDDQRA